MVDSLDRATLTRNQNNEGGYLVLDDAAGHQGVMLSLTPRQHVMLVRDALRIAGGLTLRLPPFVVIVKMRYTDLDNNQTTPSRVEAWSFAAEAEAVAAKAVVEARIALFAPKAARLFEVTMPEIPELQVNSSDYRWPGAEFGIAEFDIVDITSAIALHYIGEDELGTAFRKLLDQPYGDDLDYCDHLSNIQENLDLT